LRVEYFVLQFSVDAPLKIIASNHGCRFLFYDWYKVSFWGLEMDNYGRFTYSIMHEYYSILEE